LTAAYDGSTGRKVERFNLASIHCAKVEKEKNMKLVPRILPTVLVLISSTAFADTTASGLFPEFFTIDGLHLTAGVQLTGYPPELQFQQVSVLVQGVTPAGWFGPQPSFPGDSVLGPTTITWDDNLGLAIGSKFYDPGQFEVFPTVLDLPFFTLPAKGNFPFTDAIFPNFVLELDGKTLTNCPSTGCNFAFRSLPGTLDFEWLYQDGAWHAASATLSVPEPGTLTLLVIGIGAVGWRKLRSASLARGRSIIPV
jgi:PEP-CTERM motif-containing protein